MRVLRADGRPEDEQHRAEGMLPHRVSLGAWGIDAEHGLMHVEVELLQREMRRMGSHARGDQVPLPVRRLQAVPVRRWVGSR